VGTAAVLLGIGLLLGAFVAYQLWGTALYEAQAQANLKSELAHQLHHSLPASATALEKRGGGLPTVAHETARTLPDPAVNDPVGLLSIPRIGLLDAIVEGVGDAQLEQGPGHYPGTALPGEPGNVAIAGHRTTYAHPFYNLDALEPGDPIYILTGQGLFHYTVTSNQIVSPDDVAILDTTPGQNTLTLTTCNPRYSAAQRLVVTASFDGHTRSQKGGTTVPHPKATSIAGDSGSPSPASSSRSSLSSKASLGGGSASWVPAVLWGFAAVALAALAVVVWRVARRRWRLVVVLAAVPVVGIALLICFEHVSLALPGSY
jgi:sortase A